jgi:hypothetical protein
VDEEAKLTEQLTKVGVEADPEAAASELQGTGLEGHNDYAIIEVGDLESIFHASAAGSIENGGNNIVSQQPCVC